MTNSFTWGDALLRLGLAAATGTVIGINRGQHGRAAGLRTMLLVCTGSALAMLLGEWLPTQGSGGGDPSAAISRLAQGILAGMGFLGAGAILRQGSAVRGMTTAASLWFTTILGLCFGAGLWRIGLIGWGIAVLALFGLPLAEVYIHPERYATVTVTARMDGLNEHELRRRLEALGTRCVGLTLHYEVSERVRTMKSEVEYRFADECRLPHEVVADLSHQHGVTEVRWE